MIKKDAKLGITLFKNVKWLKMFGKFFKKCKKVKKIKNTQVFCIKLMKNIYADPSRQI